MTQNGISYVLNASNSCPKPDFICESRFMRIPINDNYCEKLLPWLDKSIEFIGEGRGGCVCLCGTGRLARGKSGQRAGLPLGTPRFREVTHTVCHREGRGQPWAGRNSAISVLTWSSTIHLPPDKAKLSSCQVIVHCLAGISRSATIAIAYIMKTMGMSSDDAYRYSSPPMS